MCVHMLVMPPSLSSNTGETLWALGHFFSFKERFQCWKPGVWCFWGYSGLQHEHSAGARSCESRAGFCTMEITPGFPWCLNNMLWEDKTGPWKGTKSNCPADTSHCTWLNRLPIGKWLLALPEICFRVEAAEKATLCVSGVAREWDVHSDLPVVCPSSTRRESVRWWGRRWAGWDKVLSLLHSYMPLIFYLPPS